MGALILDDAFYARVAQVIEYATAHPFEPRGGRIPGDNPCHVMVSGTYRIVYSVTIHPDTGERWRHLTISTIVASLLPTLHATSEIAEAFGFHGDLQDWAVYRDPICPTAIGIAQPIDERDVA